MSALCPPDTPSMMLNMACDDGDNCTMNDVCGAYGKCRGVRSVRLFTENVLTISNNFALMFKYFFFCSVNALKILSVTVTAMIGDEKN